MWSLACGSPWVTRSLWRLHYPDRAYLLYWLRCFQEARSVPEAGRASRSWFGRSVYLLVLGSWANFFAKPPINSARCAYADWRYWWANPSALSSAFGLYLLRHCAPIGPSEYGMIWPAAAPDLHMTLVFFFLLGQNSVIKWFRLTHAAAISTGRSG